MLKRGVVDAVKVDRARGAEESGTASHIVFQLNPAFSTTLLPRLVCWSESSSSCLFAHSVLVFPTTLQRGGARRFGDRVE
jgi:hypothetical protein